MRQKLSTGEDGVWDKLSPAYQTSVKAQLLQLLEVSCVVQPLPI